MTRERDTIRVGVVGVRRGKSFAEGADPSLNMKLVALCDTWEERLRQVAQQLEVSAYTDFDRFLEQDMDAVILANYFHQHAPLAIKALDSGRHVMSETAACATLAEGVALVEAVERSGRIYMFAENYPYMLFNQEMRRLYQAGTVGKFKYGEGEYVHPMSAHDFNSISPGINHWRNWIPATYYCTHSLAPIMFITDAWPTKVSGFVVEYDPDDPVHCGRTARRDDLASIIVARMDNGALVKLLQVSLRGHGNWVRIHGDRGLMENLRYGDANMVRIRREPFDTPTGELEERTYLPQFTDHQAEALRAGHGGGDFFMNYHFAQAIRTGQQPYLNVYRGVALSVVGILAYRSALHDSRLIEVPGFRDKPSRTQYAEDHWTPDPDRRQPGQPWPSVLGDIHPPEEGLAYARKVWEQMGYVGT